MDLPFQVERGLIDPLIPPVIVHSRNQRRPRVSIAFPYCHIWRVAKGRPVAGQAESDGTRLLSARRGKAIFGEVGIGEDPSWGAGPCQYVIQYDMPYPPRKARLAAIRGPGKNRRVVPSSSCRAEEPGCGCP